MCLCACACAYVKEREKKMNHLILGAVFWVTGESGGTDGRLALAGTWPPAAGRNQRTVISLDVGQEKDATHTRAQTHTHTQSNTLYDQGSTINLCGNMPLMK